MMLWKTVARLSLGAALVVASAPIVSAQMDKLKNTTPTERAKAQTMMMKTKLALTPEQTPKVQAINQKYAERMQPVIDGSAGPLVKMRQLREIRGQKDAELKKILTADQFEKYLASKEEMREHFEERMEEKHGR